MEPVVHLRSAVALAGRFPALAGVDLEIREGEVVWLRGPNGAGKTTLLRLCAGLVPLAKGEAVVLGVDLSLDRRSLRPQVGLLAHATGLYDDLTADENVRFWARCCGASPSEAAAAMDRVQLAARVRELPVERLSAGQRRRVSLAAMLVRRPRLWLLDEPHAGLDAEARALVDELVREAAGVGVTTLFASHELERAADVASREVHIVGGTVVADDPLGAASPVNVP
jgi:heme ABC exporter ATP-binding subunit CcmA